MTVSEKYHFNDFTRESYNINIGLAKKNYEFITYPECFEKNKFILWRHDVDFSMHTAKKLVEIENKNEVRATYFPKRTPEDGKNNWNQDTGSILNFIKAQSKPYPGAYTVINGKKVIIWSADIHDITNEE